MKTILVSALVLNGSRSGYRRILRNLLIYQTKNDTKYKYIYVFQKAGWLSLGMEIPTRNNLEVIVLNDFKSKWIRGLFEQIVIPLIAFKKGADYIFMPATFGLLFPVRPTLTFIHTNTHFVLEPGLRGRSRIQQYAHFFLTAITKFTSTRLAFTSEQTYDEYQRHSKEIVPKLILGNGLLKVDKIDGFVLPYGLVKDNYFLSVSQFYRLKNFDSLISAFIKLKNTFGLERGDFKLVIVGTIQELDFYNELIDLCAGRDDILFLHNIADDVLGQLYINARGYCFYSRFEGYSLTPGEALLAGVNVAISDIPTHREIYRDVPIYADPNNIDSITLSLTRLFHADSHQISSPQYRLITSNLSFDQFSERLENLFFD